MKLQILYEDDSLLAVHKPTGLHVHPSDFSRNEISLLELLQQEFSGWFAPAHRIDRATSGIVIFARNNQSAKKMGELFAQRKVSKRYLAVVRGFLEPKGSIITGSSDTKDESETHYTVLHHVELPIAMSRHPSVRYSLVEVKPITGRRHQIRKHFSSISHPIIGDVRYGDGRHNLLFREQFGLQRLLLFAVELQFQHPFTDETVHIHTTIEPNVREVFEQFGWTGNW
jgi:tRNA pseudouridine65 synthase